MQDMVAVGLIVEELSNINVKCVKYRSNIGQGHWIKVPANEMKHYVRFSGCRYYF